MEEALSFRQVQKDSVCPKYLLIMATVRPNISRFHVLLPVTTADKKPFAST